MTALQAKESTISNIIDNEVKIIEDMIQNAIANGYYSVSWFNTKLLIDWFSKNLFNESTMKVVEYFSGKGYKITSEDWYTNIKFTFSWN
jgi:hypothetical protein